MSLRPRESREMALLAWAGPDLGLRSGAAHRRLHRRLDRDGRQALLDWLAKSVMLVTDTQPEICRRFPVCGNHELEQQLVPSVRAAVGEDPAAEVPAALLGTARGRRAVDPEFVGAGREKPEVYAAMVARELRPA